MSDRARRGPVGSSGYRDGAIRGPRTGRSDGHEEEITHSNVLNQSRNMNGVESGEGADPAPGPTPPDETEAENLA